MASFDTVVAHYSTTELLDLVNLLPGPTHSEIVAACETKRQQFIDDIHMIKFFIEVQRALIEAYPVGAHTIQRFVNVDSYYREFIDVNNSNSDNYTFTLTQPLLNVLQISLYSIEVPYTWYTFTAAKGLTGMVVQTLNSDLTTYEASCSIRDGNYSNTALLDAVAAQINAALAPCTAAVGDGPWIGFSIDPVTACVTMSLLGPNLFPNTIKIIWTDTDHKILETSRINKSLGWKIGYRYDSTLLSLDIPSSTAPSIISTGCCKYMLLRLDDKMSTCVKDGVLGLGSANSLTNVSSASSNAVRMKTGAVSHATTTFATAPRKRTMKEIYAVNAQTETTYTQSRTRDPALETDIFAKIPLKKPGEWTRECDGVHKCSDDGPGKSIVEFSGPLNQNLREYYYPVTLWTLSVSIYDDHGDLLGLNGSDWSFTLQVKLEQNRT